MLPRALRNRQRTEYSLVSFTGGGDPLAGMTVLEPASNILIYVGPIITARQQIVGMSSAGVAGGGMVMAILNRAGFQVIVIRKEKSITVEQVRASPFTIS